MAGNTNSVNEEIKEQTKQVMEERNFTEKVKYFFYYYKIHLIVGALVIFFIGSIIYTIASQKEELLQVIVVNGDLNVNYDKLWNDYVSTKEYDKKKQDYTFDPYYHISFENPTEYEQTLSEKIYLMGTASELDVLICDETYFEATKVVGFGHDMSKVMTPEQMAKWGDLAVWYDCPDDSQEGEELIGIDISDFAKIKEYNVYPGTKAYFVLVLNSPYPENAFDFLEYLDTP